MRPIGFSTGALAKGDSRRGVELQRPYARLRALELSALRDDELEPLIAGIESLELGHVDYVSVHAPSKLARLSEERAFELLRALPEAWPIVVHPGVMKTPALWRLLGRRLCIENMDHRKPLGRDAAELRSFFSVYPEASFCLDVGHARQVDPTMTVALLMLLEFGGRLRQVHVSDVGPGGEHLPVRIMASWAFARIANRVPDTIPLIIESVIEPAEMAREIAAVEEAFGGSPPKKEAPAFAAYR
jgi:hypothetical protein